MTSRLGAGVATNQSRLQPIGSRYGEIEDGNDPLLARFQHIRATTVRALLCAGDERVESGSPCDQLVALSGESRKFER